MPIYEEEGRTRDDLDHMRRRQKCAECGGRLSVFMNFDTHKAYLACNDWRRTHHDGIEREASRYELEGLASFTIEKRREIMEASHGAVKAKALEKYSGSVAITKPMATEIVETLWGNAPTIEKAKCILLCHTYQLNPLMKHLYLVSYKRNYKGKPVIVNGKQVIDWSIQLGIGATRLMAQRNHNFSYLDMTPRKASAQELEKILGDTVDPNCVYGFVHIKDVDTGAEAFGLRGINTRDNIKGTEKGNTYLNMACVRAERQALDRQYPGEMPVGIEVVDERYMDIPSVGKVDTVSGEIVEGEFLEVAAAVEEHRCEEHDCLYERKQGRGGTSWYAHELPGGKWCNESKKKDKAKPEPLSEPAPEPAPETTPEPTPEPVAEKLEPELNFDPDWLIESLKKVKFTDTTVKSYLGNICKVSTEGTVVDVVARLNKEQLAAFVKEIQDRLQMA